MNMTALILLGLKSSIALSVLAFGLKATVSDSICLFRNPNHLVRAFMSMNILMPIVALTLGLAFNLVLPVKIALVALSVSPVPPIFPGKALKAGGKEDYAIGLLVTMALLAIFVVPLAIELFERLTGVPLRMPAYNVAVLVMKTVLGPLLAGVFLRTVLPSLAERAAKPIAVLAWVLLIVCLLPVLFVMGRAVLSLIGNGTILSLAAFALIGLIVGYYLGGPEVENRHVLSLATASRHPGVAAAIANTNFPEQKLVVPAILLYLIVAAILSAFAMRFWAKSEDASKIRKQRAA